MKKNIMIILTASLGLAALGSARAGIVYSIDGPNSPNSSSTFGGLDYNSSPSSRGIAFTAGPSGPFTFNTFDFFARHSSAHAAYTETFKLDLRNTTSTTPGSARAGTTLYASDTVSVSVDTTTDFVRYYLAAVDLPNISAYNLTGGQSYSLSMYSSSNPSFAIGRTTGSNYDYTTTDGFTVLGTIAGDNPNPSGPAQSYSIDIGYTSSAVPEPGQWAMMAVTLLGAGVWATRQRQTKTNVG